MTSWNFGSLALGSQAAAKFSTASCPSNDLARTNRIFVNRADFTQTTELATVASKYIYIVAVHDGVKPSQVGFNAVQRRELRLALGDEVTVTAFSWPKNQPIIARAATFEIDHFSKKAPPMEIDAQELIQQCMRYMVFTVPSLGQSFILDFFGSSLLLKVSTLISEDSTAECAGIERTTEFYFSKAPGSTLKIKGGASDSRPKDIFRPDFNFEKMGIGGLDKEFSDIFRRAFASRVFPAAVIQKLGIQHVKGMLLYGPPGTGKTLIARQIGKMLNGKEPKVVNGPEVLNKFVGQSEENIRNLFQDAENDYKENGDESELHIIIFDEIDAICKQRGMSNSSSGVGDTVVNQLLSKIDGVSSLNNILVIGMTNRKDMIDEALLRPGRLEVHVEISLPDEHGRQQILRIHTAKMKESGMLGGDVQLESLATQTTNYSGAEIEGVCKSAAAFALNRHVDYRDLKKDVDASGMQVTMSDFERALVEVQPAFGMGKDDFARCLLGGFLVYGERMTHALNAGKRFRDEVATSERSPLLSVLIEGPAGTGKTALAALLAVESGFPFVRFISPEAYVGYSEVAKCQALAKVFDDAHKSSLSVIVVDNIERLIEYSPMGPRFSNIILQTLLVLTKRVPPHGRRLLLLGTTSCVDVLHRLDYRQAFSAVLSTERLTGQEIGSIVDGVAPSMNLSQQADGNFAALHSSKTAAVSFPSVVDRDRAIEMLESKGLGIKKLLMILNMAQTEEADGRFVIAMDRLSDILRDVVL